MRRLLFFWSLHRQHGFAINHSAALIRQAGVLGGARQTTLPGLAQKSRNLSAAASSRSTAV